MKLKIITFAAIGVLLFVGAGCVGEGPLGQGKAPGTEKATPAGDVDSAVEEILQDESATTDALGDESSDSAEISTDQADINSLQDTTYETE